jgi:hypothetical protein
MTARPHYHRCDTCPGAVLCTKQGDHDKPTCIKCRRAEREARSQVREWVEVEFPGGQIEVRRLSCGEVHAP